MKIYDAYTDDGDFYTPIAQIRIFDNLQQAKEKLEKIAEDDGGLHGIFIDVRELQEGEFVPIERWENSLTFNNKGWKKMKL